MSGAIQVSYEGDRDPNAWVAYDGFPGTQQGAGPEAEYKAIQQSNMIGRCPK